MKIFKIIILVIFVLGLLMISINFYIIIGSSKSIFSINNLKSNYDMALVLGCGVKEGKPSKMLKDRLDTTISLYNQGFVKNIIVSGTHEEGYSEVDVMEDYLLNNGISKEVIIRDEKGNNTSLSIKNYYKNYKKKKLVIVTQKYHLYRSVYLATRYELKVVGVYAKDVNYHGQIWREMREFMARIKYFFLK